MTIKIGSYEVISSGTVVSVENESLDFIFSEFNNYIVRFNFVEDIETIDKSRAKVEAFSANGIQFYFTNYNSPLGTGNIKPLKIGTVKNNMLELYINYRIYSLQKGGKHIHYSFLTKEIKS
jgi:hypothetical protein